MINEVTINSNNAIEMSRGELLNWLNDLLKINLTKIEQLGTGAAYCQLIDVLYPSKIPISKVNWKAKFEYQFVANFKLLQQTFTKLGIMKHIEVEKLIKCKYQDNLEFLQWFKKIFDTNGQARDYNPLQRRGETDPPEKKKEKDTKISVQNKENINRVPIQPAEKSVNERSFHSSDRNEDNEPFKFPESINDTSIIQHNPANTPVSQNSPWRNQISEKVFTDERQFYLRKFKEIQHLCQEWDRDRPSSQLITNIRRIVLMAPEVQWKVEEGELVQSKPLE